MSAPVTNFHEPDPSIVLLHLGGELDLASAVELEAFEAAVRDHAKSRIIVDLEKVDLLSACAIHTLVRASQQAAAAGGCLQVRAASTFHRRLLSVCGLDWICAD
jgi:anti-anti-sigma factor